MTRFYVELPADEYGNVSIIPRAVVEAEITQGPTEQHPLRNPHRPYMTVIAPSEVAGRHPGWYTDAYGGWLEVDGPARLITEKEWEQLTGGKLQ